jgi:glutamate---cysteine ligase / carboxylate-amine ligase
MSATSLPWFSAYGVELEYMIVANDSLDVRPITDEVFKTVTGAYDSEVDRDALAWSNELVLHVLELKTNGPVSSLERLASLFQADVRDINRRLASWGACLMPSAAHPWMNPHKETSLWPHGDDIIYRAFDRLFGCRGHGWSNLQSAHVNLPFDGDEQFGRLHAAIRAVLPLMPALTASSPYLDGRYTGLVDARLETYRHNAQRIPLVSGRVIPEPLYSARDYQEQLLAPLYAALAPHDPEGTLQQEWVNARGAIARFSRNTIEVRVLDVQECPRADLACIRLIVDTIEELARDDALELALKALSVERLESVFLDVIRDGHYAEIRDLDLLSLFGFDKPMRAGELWRACFARVNQAWDEMASQTISFILDEGPLGHRLIKKAGTNPSHEQLKSVYKNLCECLEEATLFGEKI